MKKIPLGSDLQIFPPTPKRWWLGGVAFLFVGLVLMVLLGVWESRLNRVPLWGLPWAWLWIAAPFFGWMLAVWLSHWRRLPSFIVLAGAIVSCLGALALVLSDVLRPNKPGGMNPYATDGAGLSFLFVAVLQWLLMMFVVAMATVAWLVQRKRRRFVA